MKNIKFTELGFKKNFDTLIVVIGIVCLMIGLIAVFGYLDNRYSGLAGFSAVLTTFPQSKNLFYKNYFVWNKKGGNLKINNRRKPIIFSEIKTIKKEENQLIILKKSQTQINFLLDDINPKDLEKLYSLLEQNSIKNE
jgi:hypothetical protein